MLLPHVGRHLMRTVSVRALWTSSSSCSPCRRGPGPAASGPELRLADRYLDLWPLGTLIFVPTALGAWIMGLGGAKRFLLGCLLPPLFVAGGMLGLDSGFAPNLLASAPLWARLSVL